MNTIKIGDKVIARYPSGMLALGGKVLNIIQGQGKDPEFEVVFSSGTHNTFPLNNVTKNEL